MRRTLQGEGSIALRVCRPGDLHKKRTLNLRAPPPVAQRLARAVPLRAGAHAGHVAPAAQRPGRDGASFCLRGARRRARGWPREAQDRVAGRPAHHVPQDGEVVGLRVCAAAHGHVRCEEEAPCGEQQRGPRAERGFWRREGSRRGRAAEARVGVGRGARGRGRDRARAGQPVARLPCADVLAGAAGLPLPRQHFWALRQLCFVLTFNNRRPR